MVEAHARYQVKKQKTFLNFSSFRTVLDSFLNVCSHNRHVSYICLHGLFTF